MATWLVISFPSHFCPQGPRRTNDLRFSDDTDRNLIEAWEVELFRKRKDVFAAITTSLIDNLFFLSKYDHPSNDPCFVQDTFELL